MNIPFFSVAAIAFYSIGTIYQLLVYLHKAPAKPFIGFLLGIVAVLAHTGATYGLIAIPTGIDLSFFKVSSLIACLIVLTLLLMATQRPLRNLFLIAYPIAIISIIFALTFETPSHQLSVDGTGLLSHVILSVLAYSVFTLAAAQAALLFLQNRQLKTNFNSLFIKNLPPLQTMENLLFEMIWAGVVLLSLAIINGAIFVDNLFAQHLAHKTILSLIALAIFGTLLAGHHIQGWRGITASKWTLWGCFFLMLGYYGSKFAMEFLVRAS